MMGSPWRVGFLVVAAATVAACAGLPPGTPYEEPPAEVLRLARRSEVLLQQERIDEALAAARAAVEAAPRAAEAQRALQAARLALGEDRGVREEAARAAAAHPGDALALYLLARVEEDGDRAEALLRRAVAADPSLLWARLALCQVLLRSGRLKGAAAQLKEAESSAPGHPWPALVGAALAREREEPDSTLLLLREAAARDPARPASLEALAARLAEVPGGVPEARAALAAAFALAPGDRSLARSWRRALEEDPSPQELRAAIESVDRAAGEGEDATGPARHLRGAALLRAGEWAAALPDLRAALEDGGDRTAALEDLRLALFEGGRYTEAVALDAAETPAALAGMAAGAMDLPRARVAMAAEAAVARPGDPDALGALVAAARSVGWLREAAVAATRRAALAPGDGAAGEDVRETAAVLRFLRRFRDSWRETYFSYAGGSHGEGVDAALAALRALSLEALGVDLSDGVARRSYGLLGEMADTVRATGTCGDWFRGHGLALVVGRALGGPVEARLLRVVARAPEREYVLLGRRFPATVVVGEGLLVPSFRESGGMVLGGFTAGDLVFVDLEGVGRWAGAATRIARDDGARRRLLAVEPVFSGDEAATDLRWPGLLPERMAARHVPWRDRARAVEDFLDAARVHELAHAAQAHRFLPVLSHPLAGLGLLLRGGLSGDGVAALLEGDAELTALATAVEPRAALSTLVSFLPARRGSSPHARGYHGAMADLLEALLEEGLPADVAPGENLARALDRVDPQAIRRAAHRACQRRGVVGEP